MALLIISAAIVLLLCGYVFYGSWLAKQWGIDPSKKTPAESMADGVDYVSAKPAVLMGHHFSSIAGAGPINGPILAAVFGWVPVFLWCVIGGIFFGGLQDFGSLFASARNGGKSVGEIIKASMGKTSKKLFIIFALLVLILVIASFVNVVAGTFLTKPDEAGKIVTGFVTKAQGLTNNQTTAIISVLFIFLAIAYGVLTNRFGVKTLPATIIGIIAIAGIIVLGLNVGLALSRNAWIVIIGLYRNCFAHSCLDYASATRLSFVIPSLFHDAYCPCWNRGFCFPWKHCICNSSFLRIQSRLKLYFPDSLYYRCLWCLLRFPFAHRFRNFF